ncbi:MAG TPA: hypothetical protein VEK56_14265 [Vicinamibacterales bacterium]|nr:hypothetical protein [Vicinamibacterales bacterium]
MVQLSLSEEDAGLLRETLDAKLRDLRREISHTDSPRFRETLERLEELLQRLVTQLSETSGVA